MIKYSKFILCVSFFGGFLSTHVVISQQFNYHLMTRLDIWLIAASGLIFMKFLNRVMRTVLNKN